MDYGNLSIIKYLTIGSPLQCELHHNKFSLNIHNHIIRIMYFLLYYFLEKNNLVFCSIFFSSEKWIYAVSNSTFLKNVQHVECLKQM